MGDTFHGASGEVEAYVAVGSNIRPEANIPDALRLLRERVWPAASSTFFWNEPKGDPGQPRFINGVWRIDTAISPTQLKYDVLRNIEAVLGRQRGEDKYAPREIDLDLILYGPMVVRTPDLTVPDPDIYRYGHIAVPLLELAPDLVLPDRHVRLADLDSSKNMDGLVPDSELTSLLKRWMTS